MSADISAESRALLDAAACGLLQTSADGTFRRANQVFCSWIGRDETELVSRRKLQDLFTMGGRIFHQTHWVPLLQLQQSVSEVKFEIVHADGRTIPVVMNAIRRSTNGEIVHDVAVFVAHDRDRYERELLRTGKRLQELVTEASRLEGMANDRAAFAEEMMGIVSHDLRNPLAVIELSALGVLSTGVTPEQQLALERIGRANSRANRLIRELLDFTQARIGHGISVQVERVNIRAIINASLDELRQAFPDRVLRHAEGEACMCDADGDRIQQVIGNLVANAVTYGTPTRPITIMSTADSESCTIAVHNEGTPIPPDMQQRLFQPMTRGHHGPGGDRSVGLGLYIVSEIAKAHGGDASVTSTAESGTTFTVRLPIQRVELQPPE